MWWNALKQLWESAWLGRPGWAPLPGPHWSPSDCPSMRRGGDLGGRGRGRSTRVSSRRHRGSEIGVRVEGGTTRWDRSIFQTLRVITLRGLSFTCMCNYTPPNPATHQHPPLPPPPLPRKLSQHLIPAGRAPQGCLCNDKAPRPEGLLRVTSIQLWPPTSIKDPITQRLIICFAKKELFIHGKLIVPPSHCSASKTVLQSTKDAGLD